MTRRLRVFAPLVMIALAVACANQAIDAGDVDIAAGSTAPSFGSEDASASEASTPLAGACPTNECPPGRVTCPNTRYPCGVDLSSDDDNCGACGVACRQGTYASQSNMRCVDGTCQLVCAPGYANCNGLIDDGCEIHVSGLYAGDKENCGACGKACDVCIDGVCGCPSGKTLCADGRCHNLRNENDNCSACGNECPPSTKPPFPPEWNAGYGCSNAVCDRPTCGDGWTDCNHDFGSGALDGDGCETDTFGDPKNCGACGAECSPGEACYFGKCYCFCGASCFTSINSDIDNCGTCGYECPGSRDSLNPISVAFELDAAHGKPVCDQGVCGYACSRDWANCDGNLANGCETPLLDDPLNCGGCGIRCDGIEGQGCVNGKCLTKECQIR
jgi:hypothetical protein